MSTNMFAVPAEGFQSGLSIQELGYRAKELACRLARLGKSIVAPGLADVSPEAQRRAYEELLAQYTATGDAATWFDGRTPHALRRVLDSVRVKRTKVRLFFGDTTTGCDWLEETDVLGYIGRSTGVMKVPLLVPVGESGGAAISTHCIVRVVCAETGVELYAHSQYHLPRMELRTLTTEQVGGVPLTEKGYTHGIWVETGGQLTNQANFRSFVKAAHWVAYMNGESFDFRT